MTQYEGLKRIRSRLEALLVENETDIAANLESVAFDSPYLQKYFELRNEFANKLHSETEKITLFSLARLGELANAVGVLRLMAGSSQSSQFSARQTCEDEEAQLDSKHNYDECGEKCECNVVVRSFNTLFCFLNSCLFMPKLFMKATLLPSSDERSIKSLSRKRSSGNHDVLFSKSKLNAIIGREFNDKSDKISVYSDLGVELLHILKYTCVNAAGIRKISKKVSLKTIVLIIISLSSYVSYMVPPLVCQAYELLPRYA